MERLLAILSGDADVRIAALKKAFPNFEFVARAEDQKTRIYVKDLRTDIPTPTLDRMKSIATTGN